MSNLKPVLSSGARGICFLYLFEIWACIFVKQSLISLGNDLFSSFIRLRKSGSSVVV